MNNLILKINIFFVILFCINCQNIGKKNIRLSKNNNKNNLKLEEDISANLSKLKLYFRMEKSVEILQIKNPYIQFLVYDKYTSLNKYLNDEFNTCIQILYEFYKRHFQSVNKTKLSIKKF